MNLAFESKDQCVIQISELIRIAKILVSLSQLEEAEQLIYKCFEADKLNVDAMMLLSELYIAKRRPDLAKQQSRTALMVAEHKGYHPNEISKILEFIKVLDYHSGKNNFKTNEICREKKASSLLRELIDTKSWQHHHKRIFKLLEKSIESILAPDKLINRSLKKSDFFSALKRAESICLKLFIEARIFNFWPAYIIHCIESTKPPGSFLEFGVNKGGTINTMADAFPEKLFHGFDSFFGLQEEWCGNEVGYLNLNGKPPEVRDNVTLHIGDFEQSLDQFLNENDEKISFAHIDCDLYSSTKTIFNKMGGRLQRGAVIVFDEFILDLETKDEFQAFEEYISESPFSYRYLCAHFHGNSVAVVIE